MQKHYTPMSNILVVINQNIALHIISDYNRDIDIDIYKINHALLYGDYTQSEECRCDIVRKYPYYAQCLDSRSLLLNLLCNDPTTILRIQILALTNMKSTHCFQEYIKRGMKL